MTSRYRDEIQFAADGRRTLTFSPGDRLRRTCIELADRKPMFRYHVRVGAVWLRVPWLAWAMFS